MRNKASDERPGGISRRTFIGAGLAAVAAALVPGPVLSAVEAPLPEKKISLFNVYHQESLDAVFWRGGQYVPETLDMINHIFRDARTGDVKAIHTDLVDLLYSIQQELQSDEPFHIVSGYRTPKSNAYLRKIKKGVAKNSLHMYGKAADIRLPGYGLKYIRQVAMSCEAGGVGYYPRSKFVHIDIGDVRYWRG